jgi:DNA primase
MNVLDILTDRQLKYKEAGHDYLISCLNPEHQDNNPSMRVDKVTGIFHCFSCGFKGNLFRHYGAKENEIDIQIVNLQNKIRDILSKSNLTMPVDAVPFCRDYRGISAHTYMQTHAFTTNEIEELKGRLVFPLYDIRGNIKAYCGRDFHSELKSKYYFYPDHVSPPLFPAHPEIWKNSIIIVEGIFDALNLMDKGCYNVVCAFGTNTLLKNYEQKLAHFEILGVNKFYIMFDGDKAGNTAADKLENVLNNNGFNAERIELPEGRDPGDLEEHEITYIMKDLYGNENSDS